MYPIPANATRIKYLESTGTQYIDTGIVPTGATKVRCVFSLDNLNNFSPVFWSRGSSSTDKAFCFEGENKGQARWDYGNYGPLQVANALVAGQRYTVEVNSGTLSVAESTLQRTEQTFTGAGSIILFNFCNYVNGERQMLSVACQPVRIYGFTIYDDSTIVRDFVPVRIGSVGCLFDRVTGQFFYNQGTGNFVCGEDDFSIFSHAVKHLSGTGTFLASRAMGDSSGAVKAVRKHYDMLMQYTIDECNGNSPTAANVYFPSGTYDALDYTPTWSGHRFVGWYTTSATPSTTAPTSGTQVQKGDSVVFDRSTVYARWQLPTTVTFDATTNGGQMPSGWVSPDYYIGQVYGTLPQPTKSGEVFLGWFTSGGTRITESSTVTTGILTARYAAVTWATTYSCTTTSSYKNTGIYSANRYSSSAPIVVDWGDGTTDVVYGNISQLAHTYPSVATYTVRISDNISTFCPSYSDSTWYQTTSQNRYTFKKVLTLSSKVTQLSTYAFYYCSAMTDAIIPSGATSIPIQCFYYCSQLKSSSVQLPSTVTSIGSNAFYYCNSSNFNSIAIPGACTSIGSQAFYQCYYLHPIFESGSATLTLSTYSFSYCGYNGSAFAIDLSPRKMTSIPNYCFYYCRYLNGVTLPQGLTSIGGSAFRYCFYYSASTGTVEIPEGVTSFSSTYAFANCSYLTAVTLPSTLTNLNNYTFYYCTRLATITCNRSTAPTVSSATFGNSSTYYTGRSSYSAGTNRLYVPAGATSYDTGPWADPLCSSTKCGFTLVEVEPPGIYVEFNNVTSSYAGLTNYTDTLRFDLTPTVNSMNWSIWLRDGQTLPNDTSEFSGISICDPDTGGNLVMLWSDAKDFAKIDGIDTSSPTVTPYNVDSGTITIRKVEA